jgi:aspartate carbamoyltransferase regulatory subunit
MHIDSIRNGLVIDHITAGKGMRIYELLGLGNLDCTVAIIKNSNSRKMGKKDITKIDAEIDVDLDILGYVDPGITINVIKNGELIEKKAVALPETLTNVIKCKNPRCITTTEQELPQIFTLTDPERAEYRCIYCETLAKN